MEAFRRRRADEEIVPDVVFLDDEELLSLSTYKYHGVDLSIVTKYVLEPFWNFLIERVIPYNIAANLLTLAGFISNVVALFLCLFESGWGAHPAPKWVYLVCSILNALYQHLDGIDGKQARRTGMASPLGQLFDHGADALCVGFHTIIIVIAMESFDTLLGLLLMFITSFGFAVYTYEEYHTKVLRLTKISGPVEGLIIMQILLLIVGIFGPDMFKTTLFEVGFRYPLSVQPFDKGKQPISVRDLILNCVFISGIYMIVDSFVVTYKSLCEKLREEDEMKFLSKQTLEGTVAEETDSNGIPAQARDKLVKYCQEKYRDTPIMYKTIGIERYSAPEGIIPDCNPLKYYMKHTLFTFIPFCVIFVVCFLGSLKARLPGVLLYNVIYAHMTLRIILGRLCGMKEAEMIMPFYKKGGKWHPNLLIEFIFPILLIIELVAPEKTSTALWCSCALETMVLANFIPYLVKQIANFLGVPIFTGPKTANSKN